uniref:Uncharacterized protein n=1 Tax=Phlebotomus papatasi TaxID=29031 RepID=A0A1B0EZL6_PHLPP
MSEVDNYHHLHHPVYTENWKEHPESIELKLDELEKADAFLVVYSVVDKASFSRCEQLISMLQDMDLVRSRALILVGNKIDLARSRAVSSQ